jgi:5-methylcytosine-specific restriction protein A
VIDPINHLVPVCPNCHNMLHRKAPPYTPEELKEIINKTKYK